MARIRVSSWSAARLVRVASGRGSMQWRAHCAQRIGFASKETVLMVYSGQEWCLFIKIVSTFVGNNWVRGRCGNGGNGVIKLGFFKYNEGMEDCLNSCRIFGLTACEFDKDDGECWAYSNDVAIGKGKPVTFCYKFKGITFKHASWPYFHVSHMS